MSMFDIFNVSGSALSAQSQRLNAVASNLANAESVAGPDGQVYRAKQVVFSTMPVETAGPSAGAGESWVQGVRVSQVLEDNSPPKQVYDPRNPMADADGYVALPNVNPVEEMVNMISASRSYQSNVEVMNTAKSLLQKVLTLGS